MNTTQNKAFLKFYDDNPPMWKMPAEELKLMRDAFSAGIECEQADHPQGDIAALIAAAREYMEAVESSASMSIGGDSQRIRNIFVKRAELAALLPAMSETEKK